MKALGFMLSALIVGALAAPAISASRSIEMLSAETQRKIARDLFAEVTSSRAEHFPVIVMMRDQVDLERLNTEIAVEGLDRRVRSERVIPVLKDAANQAQAPLLRALDSWQQVGTVRAVRPLWIIDAVLLSGTREALAEIAGRDDVGHLFLDGVIDSDRAFPEAAANGTMAAAPGQAERGLRVVNAPALWDRGYTGAGILVMNLDTGVDGNHPSMADRWLGNDPQVLDTDAWFDNPLNQACPTPCDYDTHGTLTLSVVTGLQTETADTVGVAFGSQWIAGAVVGTTTGVVLSAIQWAAEAPGGTRPPADVMNLSIQDPSVGAAGDCGPNGVYWAAVDAFEALGGAVVWAAGNEGPGPQTINYPKNRITTPVNMFTVGNISPHVPTFPIHTTSSRGPSICDGLTPKPEVVAPGTTIRVATPGGGYNSFTGTSLAAPHVAGVIALLMEAFPSVTGTEIKFALLATARDLGTLGEDNTYGMGLIDAGAAYDLLAGTVAIGEEDAASPPNRISLSEVTPNPFTPSTSLDIGLPAAARVSLHVYNLQGQVVASLLDSAERSAGRHVITWDGRTSSGERVPSGVYFFRLTTRDHDSGRTGTWLRKVVLVD